MQIQIQTKTQIQVQIQQQQNTNNFYGKLSATNLRHFQQIDLALSFSSRLHVQIQKEEKHRKIAKLPWRQNNKLFLVFVFCLSVLLFFLSFLHFFLSVFCLFCLFVQTSCWSNVWRASSLKSPCLCRNSKVAVTDSLTDSLTKVRYRAARAAKKWPEEHRRYASTKV